MPPGTTTGAAADTTMGGSSTGRPGLGEGEDCSLLHQDCAEGLKCMPYTTTPAQGGIPWEANGCFPVHPDPVGPGEPCQWFDGFFSGHDNCGFAQVCMGFSEDHPGECRDLCRVEDPDDQVGESLYCPDPKTGTATCQRCFCWCEPVCNPLEPNCEEGEVCVPGGSGYFNFGCVPQAAGEPGAYGDSCEFINTCGPGLVCADGSAVPGCEGIGCCTPVCDVTEPNTCPGEGQTCQIWFPEGDSPLGHEDVGACAL